MSRWWRTFPIRSQIEQRRCKAGLTSARKAWRKGSGVFGGESRSIWNDEFRQRLPTPFSKQPFSSEQINARRFLGRRAEAWNNRRRGLIQPVARQHLRK